MKEIQSAAELVNSGSYPPDVGPDALPPGLAGVLSKWPTPPCPWWNYDWENWDGGGTLRVTLRNASNVSVVYLCIYTSGNCHSSDGTDVTQWASKELTCNE